MELPQRMPEKQEYRRILGEFYDGAKTRQWFHRAELIELHSTHMKPTLEIYCSYNPVLEMKEILQFTDKYKLALEIVTLSNKD